MKKLLAVLLALVLCVGCAGAEEAQTTPQPSRFRIEENGLYGVADAEGNVVIPCEYEMLGLFWNGDVDTAMKDGKCGVIRSDGTVVVPFEWDSIAFTGEEDEFLRVFKGEMVRRYSWDEYAYPGEGLYGLYAIDGTEITPCQWDYVSDVAEGLFAVWSGERCAIYDLAGKAVVPLTECNGMYVNADGTIRIRQGTPDGDERYARSGVFDLTGQVIVPCVWGDIGDFSEGLATVRDGDVWGYVNLQGEVVIPVEWDYAQEFSGGYAIVRQDGQYGVIDTTGELVIPCEWETLEALGDGRFEGTKTTVIEVADGTQAY